MTKLFFFCFFFSSFNKEGKRIYFQFLFLLIVLLDFKVNLDCPVIQSKKKKFFFKVFFYCLV